MATSSDLTTLMSQDIHISCPRELVEIIIAEFKQQFAEDSNVEIYDWGWSERFQLSYIVLSWQGRVPSQFEQLLNADPRLEGHTVYDLPARLVVPLVVVV
jgi:hypothetical protein